MSAVERFRQAWDARFPSVPAPDLPCLRSGQQYENVAYGSVYGTVYSSLNPAAIEQALQLCNATIAELHLQLERQQFVAEYLWEVLHGINSASVVDSPSPVLTPKHGSDLSLRMIDRAGAAAVPLETDLSTAVSSNSGLDSVVPILDSPSSSNFSPLSLTCVDGKVFTEERTVGLTHAESVADPMSECNSTDLDKCQQSIKRKSSLPLLDRNQNDRELESEIERTFSLDSKPQNVAFDVSKSDAVTPVNSFRHKPVTPSPSMPLQKAHRQKPVPTPRVTVGKQAASAVVNVEDSTVGESFTDDPVSSSDIDAAQQLQQELKNVLGGSNSFNQSSLKHVAQSNVGAESAVDDDQKVRSVKQRALAFTMSTASNNTSSSALGSGQKLAASDSITSGDGSSPQQRMRGRRAQRAHVYEEVMVPVKVDAADSDEAGAVSSDDEEPLYFNLKMLQQTMLNRAKTFYSKGAQRPTVEQGKNVDSGSEPKFRSTLMPSDAHQLSGDSSK